MPNESEDAALADHLLKRKRATLRAKVTRLIHRINDMTVAAPPADVELCINLLTEAISELQRLDVAVQDCLSDADYDNDVIECERREEDAKGALLKATHILQSSHLSAQPFQPISSPPVAIPPPPPPTPVITTKVPHLVIETFHGDLAKWQRFWEQFSATIDQRPHITTIDKHVFLRSYLRDEPRTLTEGIAITADNYEVTKQLLLQKYGDINRIIQTHVDYLENLSPLTSPTPQNLSSLFINCRSRIQALKALGEDVNCYGRILTPKLLRAFPERVGQQWISHAKRNGLRETSLEDLMNYLCIETESSLAMAKIKGEHAIPTVSEELPTSTFSIATKKNDKTPTTAKHSTTHVQHTTKQARVPWCAFCTGTDHYSDACKAVTQPRERSAKLREENRCFLCLQKGHMAKRCTKIGKWKCSICQRNHHRAICESTSAIPKQTPSTPPPSSQPAVKPPDSSPNTTTVGNVDIGLPSFTYLQTARVRITGTNGLQHLTRCVLDSGSQSSFISAPLIDQLHLEVVSDQQIAVKSFETPAYSTERRRVVRFTISDYQHQFSTEILAFESNNRYSPHPRIRQPAVASTKNHNLQLADPEEESQDRPIELLIGSDFYWRIVKKAEPISLTETLVLLPSHLGWILHGTETNVVIQHIQVNNVSVSNPFPHFVPHCLWDLESIGIKDDTNVPLTQKHQQMLDDFARTFRIHKNRAIVSLPWKPDAVLHSDNKTTAFQRFDSLRRKFQANPDLQRQYELRMAEHIQLQHIEKVQEEEGPPERTYYLPHHAILKPHRQTTKCRIVFDGSSRERGSISLNEALEVGPNLIPDVLATLLRFRLYPCALVADGSKAFLQLELAQEDRDVTRFFWFDFTTDVAGTVHFTTDVVIYRFNRLPFGLVSSPYLLAAALRQTANISVDRYPLAAISIDKSVYMDDFLSGTNDDKSALILYRELTDLMAEIQLPMTKWATNSAALRALWTEEHTPYELFTRVLGVDWDTETDNFQINYSDIPNVLASQPGSKRLLLGSIARFYDPLGLFTPVSITAKILFQDTWSRKLDWDEILPHDLASRWSSWISDLENLQHLTIPRWVGTNTLNRSSQRLHVFCDASQRAYGAALYVRLEDTTPARVFLICSKSRLAPTKSLTLPRLELMAALIGCRLLRFFCTETNQPVQAILWTDATAVLGWINGSPTRWKTFVANRISEIRNTTTPEQWRHCPGTDNPADFLTRGLSIQQLQNQSTWWHGPSWLAQPSDTWPPLHQYDASQEITPEESKTKSTVLQVSVPTPQEDILDISRFSKYQRLLRSTAWALRFIFNCRNSVRKGGELTASELSAATTYWIGAVQRSAFTSDLQALTTDTPLPVSSSLRRYNPFLDAGLIRLGGRLHFAPLSEQEKHPFILHGKHRFTQLLIEDTHVRLHHLGTRIILSELRTRFWILKGRQTIKSILSKCLPCRKQRATTPQQIEAPLPLDRMKSTSPFAVTGIDFAGPLYIRQGVNHHKAYIVLFTCASVRAIHLELASDMTTESFFAALQRFIGRRGVPTTIYSDNAKTFHASDNVLSEIWKSLSGTAVQSYLAHRGVHWKFIVERAAWWGGWWERMIGTVKRCLRKTIGRQLLTSEQMNTVLVGVEAALNSRPIVYDYDSTDDEPLTPAHFLVGRKLTKLPAEECHQENQLTHEWKLRQRNVDEFWRRWTKEYLMDLRNYHQVKQPNQALVKIGDIAMISEETRPRHLWKIGRIQDLKIGRDGKFRTCILQLPNRSKISRPIQLVIPLEVDQGGEDVRI